MQDKPVVCVDRSKKNTPSNHCQFQWESFSGFKDGYIGLRDLAIRKGQMMRFEVRRTTPARAVTPRTYHDGFEGR